MSLVSQLSSAISAIAGEVGKAQRSLQDTTTPATPIVSNANTYTDITSYAAAAGLLSTKDVLVLEFWGDLLNNSGASVVYDWKLIVGSTDLTTLPSAGFSFATGANRRPVHVVYEITVVSATTCHIFADMRIAAAKAASAEAALFNGTTSAIDSQQSVAPSGFNVANAMTFKMQGKTRTNSASADLRLTRATWSLRRGV